MQLVTLTFEKIEPLFRPEPARKAGPLRRQLSPTKFPKIQSPSFLDGAQDEILGGSRMASPNYAGEKRRKDLAKQAKKKEKLAKKLEKSREANSAPKSEDSES